MRILFKNTAVYAWVVLVMLTSLSWWLSLDAEGIEVTSDGRLITTALFFLAFFKVRLVIIHFMEIGTAPILLRALFEAWVVIVCAVMLGLYWLA